MFSAMAKRTSIKNIRAFGILAQFIVYLALLPGDCEGSCIAKVYTKDEYKYATLDMDGLHIKSKNALVFKVQACNDAHIGLFSHNPSSKSGMLYEIVISGWSNKRSAIRATKQRHEKAHYDYKGGLLNCKTYKTFWISWRSGHVKVGRGRIVGKYGFMDWKDPKPHAVNYAGVSTGWGSKGSWKFKVPCNCIAKVYTKDEYKYATLDMDGLHIKSKNALVFKVQACNDAHIGLFSHNPSSKSGMLYEIVISGWSNKRSAIRATKQRHEKAHYDYKGGLLNCKTYKTFWISWRSGHVKVGRGRIVGKYGFMDWKDPKPHAVNYAGVSTGWGSKGSWKFKVPCNGIDYVRTPDLYKYVALDSIKSKNALVFKVQACNDAHIGLFSHISSSKGGMRYEIVISGWSNTKSVIRATKQRVEKVSYKGKLLNCKTYKTFWISWRFGHVVQHVKVGRGKTVGKNGFMDWKDHRPHAVNYVGFSTGWGTEGKWKINVALNGGWSKWRSYSQCSQSCKYPGSLATGTKTRTRTCNNPKPKNGGKKCAGKRKETVSCSSSSICLSIQPQDDNECRKTKNGVDYKGTVRITKSGKTCQRWDSQKPHQHGYETGFNKAKNYCRNLGEGLEPWCYTTDANTRWEYCTIPFCDDIRPKDVKECRKTAKGVDYKGTTGITKSGKKCLRWDSQKTYKHKVTEYNNAENYCRNSGDKHAPWCFTTDKSTRWEYCSIPFCAPCSIDHSIKNSVETTIVSGDCEFHTRSKGAKCEYSLRLRNTEGIEAIITIGKKIHYLKENQAPIKGCATFQFKKSELVITVK